MYIVMIWRDYYLFTQFSTDGQVRFFQLYILINNTAKDIIIDILLPLVQ